MNKKGFAARVIACILSVGMVMGLTSCGKSEDGGKTPSGTATKLEQFNGKETVYQASYINLGLTDYLYDVSLVGDLMTFFSSYEDKANDAYVQQLYSMDVSSSSVKPVELPYKMVNHYNQNYNEYAANTGLLSDGTIYLTIDKNETSGGVEKDAYILTFFNKDTSETKEVDITEYLSNDDGSFVYPYFSTEDANDNIIMSNGESKLWVFDKEGTYLKTIELDNVSWVESLSKLGKEGVLISYWNDNGDTILEKINTENGEIKTLPSVSSTSTGYFSIDSVISGPNGEIYLKTSDGIYDYNPENGETTEVLIWRDSDLDGEDIAEVFCDSQGQFFAIISESIGNEKYTNELAVLRETPVSEIPVKEVISLGVLSDDRDITKAVIRFNRKSDKYRIEIKEYYTNDGDYEAAVETFNNDVMNGTAPDIVQTQYLNVNSLSAKGVFVDLNEYLDKDPDIKREDYFESVLYSCTTKDGLLYAIPSTFSIITIFGREDEIGADKGWTIQEMAKAAADNPDKSVFKYYDKGSVLSMLLYTNYTQFIDWHTGECHFDSEDFIDTLKFANTFPKEVDYDDWDEVSGLQDGTTLLYQDNLSGFYDYELAQLMFGEDSKIVAKGFPTAQGNGSCLAYQGALSINASSTKPDAAWEFIKSFVSPEYYVSANYWSFPSLISAFDKSAAEAMEVETYIDDNGEEQVVSNMTYGIGNFSFEMKPVTQEQFDELKDIISNATANINYDTSIYAIIEEEAAAFFDGGKTAEDAAAIIQSRVQMYVDESR